MNVDLTQMELAQIIRLTEADDMSKPVNGTLHAKATQCLQNFAATVSQPPEPGLDTRADLEPNPDPRAASGQWRQPI